MHFHCIKSIPLCLSLSLPHLLLIFLPFSHTHIYIHSSGGFSKGFLVLFIYACYRWKFHCALFGQVNKWAKHTHTNTHTARKRTTFSNFCIPKFQFQFQFQFGFFSQSSSKHEIIKVCLLKYRGIWFFQLCVFFFFGIFSYCNFWFIHIVVL